MNSHHVTYLIVGAGLAGSAAAQAIRLRDPRGSVLLIGQEVNRPYNRPPLRSSYLLKQVPRTDLITLPVGWFNDNNVQLITGQRVAHIDVARHAATLDTGMEVVFDKLLLATGVNARPLNVQGADFPNVYDLRTIEDADQILNALDQARGEGRPHDPADRTGPRGRVTVVGSGLLGLELCQTLTTAGARVDLLCSNGHPWRRFAGEQVGAYMTRLLQRHEVAVHAHARVARLEGDGRVQRVVTDDGRSIDTDFVLTALGTVFNRDILRGTPINAEKHILVDSKCRTNVADVYAAGDCAAVLDPLFGKHRVLEHWASARLLGTIAGANMAGDDSMSYDAVSHFDTEVFGARVDVWGDSRHVAHRHTRIERDGAIIEFGIAPTLRISQVVGVNAPKSAQPLLEDLVRRRLNVSDRSAQLTDPSVPLAALLDPQAG